MRKIFIDSIINLVVLSISIIIFASSFLTSKIQLSIHYHRANISPLLILFIFVFGSLLSSFLSGWLLLSQYYFTDIPSPPLSSTWQTGNIGFVSYRNSLNIGITEEGHGSFSSTFINSLGSNYQSWY